MKPRLSTNIQHLSPRQFVGLGHAIRFVVATNVVASFVVAWSVLTVGLLWRRVFASVSLGTFVNLGAFMSRLPFRLDLARRAIDRRNSFRRRPEWQPTVVERLLSFAPFRRISPRWTMIVLDFERARRFANSWGSNLTMTHLLTSIERTVSWTTTTIAKIQFDSHLCIALADCGSLSSPCHPSNLREVFRRKAEHNDDKNRMVGGSLQYADPLRAFRDLWEVNPPISMNEVSSAESKCHASG